MSLKNPRRKHISLREGQGFSLGRYHRRQPIAREWHPVRKRIAATVACFNTVFIGLIAGIYVSVSETLVSCITFLLMDFVFRLARYPRCSIRLPMSATEC